MNYLTSFLRKNGTSIAVMGLVLLAFAVLTEPAYAQLPQFDSVSDALKERIGPIVTFVQWIIVIFCFVAGLWEAFKASRGGDNKGWLNALLLWIVGGVAAAPSQFLSLLGLKDLAAAVNEVLSY